MHWQKSSELSENFSKKTLFPKCSELKITEEHTQSHCHLFHENRVETVDGKYKNWVLQHLWLRRRMSIEVLLKKFRPLFSRLYLWFLFFFIRVLIKFYQTFELAVLYCGRFFEFNDLEDQRREKVSRFAAFSCYHKVLLIVQNWRKPKSNNILQIKKCQSLPWYKNSIPQ